MEISLAGYNTLLSVTSYSDKRNKDVADKFENETGISLRVNVPSFLEEMFSSLGLTFPIFEKNPSKAMEFLKRMS